jgi:hypothetical protein
MAQQTNLWQSKQASGIQFAFKYVAGINLRMTLPLWFKVVLNTRTKGESSLGTLCRTYFEFDPSTHIPLRRFPCFSNVRFLLANRSQERLSFFFQLTSSSTCCVKMNRNPKLSMEPFNMQK